MARRSLKAGALTAPLPPVMVTVGDMEKSNIITIAWTGILATHPPRTYISVRPSRHSYEILKERGEFVINLPCATLARVVDYVGIYTGAKVDKFAVTGLTRVPSVHVAAPTIEECPIAIECRVAEVLPMGTHDVFVADIVGVSADERIIDAEGRLCFERADLLAYAHGEYFKLGECVGAFGFSTKKTKRTGASASRKKPIEDVSEKHNKGTEAAPRDEKKLIKDAPEKHNKGAEAASRDEKKPFYLTAPRKHGAKRSRGGKKR